MHQESNNNFTYESNNTNDINSFGELEKRLYDSENGITMFQRELVKCTPFSKKTIPVTKNNGSSNFGYTHAFIIDTENGHYLNNTFLMITLPEVSLREDNVFKSNGYIRWCNNLAHNIIEDIALSFNDQVVSRLDSFALDFHAEFENSESKYNEYMRMIGNIPELTTPQKKLESRQIVLPIPFFFSKDSGASLPLFAMKRTEIKISISYKNWENILILENSSSLDVNIKVPDPKVDLVEVPNIVKANLYATVSSVSKKELEQIGKPSSILIESVQSTPRQSIHNTTDKSDILLFFKNAVRKIYFGVSNTMYKNDKSNYGLGHDKFVGGIFCRNDTIEVVDKVSIKYGNNDKENMDIGFYKFIQPYYYCKRVPSKNGMYTYSFALEDGYEPCGSSNFHRIGNIKMSFTFKNKKLTDTMELIVIGISHSVANVTQDGIVEVPIYS